MEGKCLHHFAYKLPDYAYEQKPYKPGADLNPE